MRNRVIVSILLGSSPIVWPFYLPDGNIGSKRRPADERCESSTISRTKVDERRRLYMSACLPDIDGMRMSEIRQELGSYGIQVRSTWGGQELATALKRARVENAERRRLAKQKQDRVDQKRKEEMELTMRQAASYYFEHASVSQYEPGTVEPIMMDDTSTSSTQPPRWVDAEQIGSTTTMAIEHETINNNNEDKKMKRPVISRIGGFLSRKREKRPQMKHQRRNSSKTQQFSEEEEELPFFLEFLHKEEANKGPISVEVVRLQTWKRDDSDEADASGSYQDGKRNRILYTKGLGSRDNNSNKTTKRKPNRNIAIVPLGVEEHYNDNGSSSGNFIGTYSRGGQRRVDFHHHFQVVPEDETTKTHKLLHDDPTLRNCTVIDVPVKPIQLDWRDPDLFSRLKCDDWNGFTA